jgi:hypothetical protein
MVGVISLKVGVISLKVGVISLKVGVISLKVGVISLKVGVISLNGVKITTTKRCKLLTVQTLPKATATALVTQAKYCL